MDKNTFAGLFLMLAIIVGSFYFMPSQDEIAQEQRLQDSLAGKTTWNFKKFPPIPRRAGNHLLEPSYLVIVVTKRRVLKQLLVPICPCPILD